MVKSFGGKKLAPNGSKSGNVVTPMVAVARYEKTNLAKWLQLQMSMVQPVLVH